MSMNDEIDFRGMKYEYKGTRGNGCADCDFSLDATACDTVNRMLGGCACPLTNDNSGPSWQLAKMNAPPQACT